MPIVHGNRWWNCARSSYVATAGIHAFAAERFNPLQGNSGVLDSQQLHDQLVAGQRQVVVGSAITLG
jgi:hypothetical protein